MRRYLHHAIHSLAILSLGASPFALAEEPLTPPRRVVARDSGGLVVDLPEKPEAKTEPAAKPVAKAVVVAAARPLDAGASPFEYGDPYDSKVRFLLLTTVGPLIVEVDLTLNGEPFRMYRERQVQELLAAGDTNLDGVPTWTEGMENPRFSRGTFARALGNALQQKSYLKSLDANGNGIMERNEVQRLVGQRAGVGDSFNLNPSGVITHPDLRPLIDTDGNGGLSIAELAAAGERLKSRDANDNDLVDMNELGSGQANPYQFGRANRVGTAPQYHALRIMEGLNLPNLRQILLTRYHPGGPLTSKDWPLVPQTAAALDADQNGNIEEPELAALATLPPHIKLTGNFGRKAKQPAGLTLVEISAELGAREKVVEQKGNSIRVTLAGLKLELNGIVQMTQATNYEQQAKVLFDRLDADKNGYLEKKESAQVGPQFEQWDEDADGKVYPAEVAVAYERLYAPQLMQIAAATADRGNAIFATLDTNNDGRLSARELKYAASRLAQLDYDGDGYLASGEIPASVAVTFGQGAPYAFAVQPVITANGTIPRPGQPGAQADWFTRMDRNGDGDLTPREFLGTPEQFARLDVDADGFVTRDEAQK